MKLTLLLTVIAVINLTAATYSQEKKLNVNLSSATIGKVFKAIEDQSDFNIFYKDNQINTNTEVNLNMKNATINEILDKAFQNTHLSYTVLDKIIVISDKGMMKFQVTGSVSSGTDHSPIVGATIIEKGTQNAAITDMNGKFKLDVKSSDAVLVVSFIGYESTEVMVNGLSKLDIVLKEKSMQLNEVVVVGYGKSSRKMLSSAITTVNAKELNNGSFTNIGQLLQGKVPGLNISVSGDPNKQAAIILRGSSTINGAQAPFYVIDGIPGADISVIAPDDIASVDILKDAAATAIYGNRAANGVIQVTTKKGTKGPMKVTYSGYIGFEKVSNQLNMMNASQLRAFATKTNQSFAPADDKTANTNWQTAIERSQAVSTNHNLSFSGGSDHSNYSASINYVGKEGIILGSNLSRVIARLSLEQYALNDKVKFGLSISNSNSVADNVPQLGTVLLQAVNHLPVSPVLNANGSYFENFTNTGYFNPVAMINHGKDQTKYNNLVASFTTEVKLPFGLTYNLNISYQNQTSLHGEYYDSYYALYNSANFYNNPDPPAVHSLVNFGSNGSALRNSYQNSSKILETYFSWDKKFGAHAVNAVVGYSWQGNINGDGFQASSTNFPVDNLSFNNLYLSNPYAISSYRVNFGADQVYNETRLISDFARLNYNFKEKYLFQASIRNDGSSVFGNNKKWGYFPSVGVAWRISQESFMKGQTIFSDLKLRGSYGATGNSTGFNPYTPQFMSGSNGTYYYNGVQVGAYGPVQAANPDLQWEKTATTNLGLDFTILKGKVSGLVEWYNKKTTEMIFNYAVDPILVPVGSIVANGGSMSNKGIEVTLNAMIASGKDFSWSTNVNIAHNVNKILSMKTPLFNGGDSVRITQPEGGGQTGSTLQILKAGKPLGEFFTLEYAGKNSAGVSQYVASDGSLTTSPVIGKDYHYAGSAQPNMLLGWTNTFRYKNFDLNIFMRGVFGNKIFNATRADLFRPANAHATNILVDAANESVTDGNAYKYSTRFIEDGSYIRMDNATLGYNFKHVSQYISSLRIYASANNLFVITKYKGVDPEVNQGGNAPGVDSNNFFPKTRTFLFGVNVSF